MSKSKVISILILSVSLLIVVISIVYMYHLSQLMALEEQKRVHIWADATEQFILAGPDDDIDFYTQIIEDNTSIPVYMVDSAGQILLSRNVDRPVADPTLLHGPIEVRVEDQVQYIYYDDSSLLSQLRYFPYVQLALIVIFLLITMYLVYVQQRSEQDKVWVGLTKETAHQLGTPISSLNAWQELLESKYPEDEMIPEMRHDIDRLRMVADRFGKVGSVPELTMEPLDQLVEKTTRYMRQRMGRRITLDCTTVPAHAMLSASLFSWVLENLIKNAVDASATSISITLTEEGNVYQIDIADNGKGIAGRHPQRVFAPGYTTKKRGWGLGLSLAKRIVEDYHRGHLLLQQTEPGVGTTFRILLKKPEDRTTAA